MEDTWAKSVADMGAIEEGSARTQKVYEHWSETINECELEEMLDDAPEFVDSEPPILTAEEPVVRIKGTEAEDKLLRWTGQQRR